MKTAVLVDGGFFLYRFRRVFPGIAHDDPRVVAKRLHRMCLHHLFRTDREAGGKVTLKRQSELFRIFFYDCAPLTKRVHYPISGKALNLKTTNQALFRTAFHDEVRKLRKVALRLGHLDERNADWQLKPGILKELLKRRRTWASLTDDEFTYYARQKVVDMKVGIDITRLAENRLVDQIVLVAGDSDFVPAAKHARRTGIDFILDPMWNHIQADLHEHIDGLRSTCPRPGKKTAEVEMPAIDEDADEAV